MTAYTLNTPVYKAASHNNSFGTTLINLFAESVDAVKAELEIRQAIRDLNALSDKELADMGIERYNIAARVRGK